MQHRDTILAALRDYEYKLDAFYDGAPEAIAERDRARAAIADVKAWQEPVANALLPCPFCGTEPSIEADGLGGTIIACDNDDCPVVVEYTHHVSALEATQDWNHRACLVLPSASVALDMPDAPGWWAFEGDFLGRPFRTCHLIVTWEPGAHTPYYRFRGDDIDSDMDILRQEYIGKWIRVYMPWELSPVPAPIPDAPAPSGGTMREDIGLCAAAVVLAYYRKTHDHILQDTDTLQAALRVEKWLGRR